MNGDIQFNENFTLKAIKRDKVFKPTRRVIVATDDEFLKIQLYLNKLREEKHDRR
jgi:hypothetical protein